MKAVQKGFTLIELMIVIAIVAILVALAVPAYQDYAIRAKVSECIAGAAPAKLAVSEYWQTVGSSPTTTDLAGIDTTSTTPFCSALTYATSVITVTTNANTGAEIPPTVTLTATRPQNNGPVQWTCNLSSAAGTARHVPSNCRAAAP